MHLCASSADLQSLFTALRADLIMVFQAYCDESGTDASSEFTCVAGYLFEPGQCVRLDTEWCNALQSFGIDDFHMADCAHGTGQFSKLSKEQRSNLAAQCIGIIKRRARIGVIASLAQSDFRRFQTANSFHDAYVACLIMCMGGVTSWAQGYANGQKIAYFFESGAKLEKRAGSAIEWSRNLSGADRSYYSHSFIGKRDAKALQAADLLAWEWQKELNNMLGPKRRPRRLSLRSLLVAPHIYCHISYDHMAALLTESNSEVIRGFHMIEPNDRNLVVVTRQPVA